LNHAGDGASCAKATTEDKRPPEGCGAVLRIEVAKLGAARAVHAPDAPDAAPSPMVGDLLCPPGSTRTGNDCIATKVACPDPRAVFRDGTCIMPKLVELTVPVDAPSRGSATAPVTINAFVDLECPFCARAMTGAIGRTGGFAQAVLAHPNDVRVVFRHEPLAFHKGAEPAHEFAMEAKAEKGDESFWHVAFAIWGSQQAYFTPAGIDMGKVDALATIEGLDLGKVHDAMTTHKYKARIDADAQVAATNGLQGTPTFVVGDEVVIGAQSDDEFEAAIARQKARAGH
jgi:protein-disulfide isomerase